MALEDVAKFYEIVLKDEKLQQMFGSVEAKEIPEMFAKEGQERGYQIEPSEVATLMEEQSASELSEDDLEAVTGGTWALVLCMPSGTGGITTMGVNLKKTNFWKPTTPDMDPSMTINTKPTKPGGGLF